MSTTCESDLALGRRFRDGDDLALVEMYRRFSGPMYVTALSLLGRGELAADAVQQAFVRAWRAAGSFDPSRELAPWLYAITRRAAVDVYRRHRRGVRGVAFEESWADEARFAVDGPSLDSTWRAWQVRAALRRLPPDERRVLHLAYYEGMTQSEVAAALGIALGTVKSRTARAQRRLADLLGHLRDGDRVEPVAGASGRRPRATADRSS